MPQITELLKIPQKHPPPVVIASGETLRNEMIDKGRVQKKIWEKVWSFAKPGGGSPGVVKKPNCFFETEFFSESI